MITPLEFFGGAVEVSTGVNLTLDMSVRFWRVKATVGSLTISLPPRTTPGIPFGTPVLIIANAGTNSFILRDFEVSAENVNVTMAGSSATPKANIVSFYQHPNGPRWFYQPVAGSLLLYTSY